MSIRWWFHSFPEQRWGFILAGGDPDAAAAIMASATWEGNFDSNSNLTRQIATLISERGISYRSMDETSAEVLDGIVSGFFSPEGLEEFLHIEYNSPDGLDRDITDEVIRRLGQRPTPSLFSRLFSQAQAPRPAQLSPLFLTGRRIGGGQPTFDAMHFVLAPTEVAELRAEVESAFSLRKYWSHVDNEFAAKELLLEPLLAIERKGFMLAATLG